MKKRYYVIIPVILLVIGAIVVVTVKRSRNQQGPIKINTPLAFNSTLTLRQGNGFNQKVELPVMQTITITLDQGLDRSKPVHMFLTCQYLGVDTWTVANKWEINIFDPIAEMRWEGKNFDSLVLKRRGQSETEFLNPLIHTFGTGNQIGIASEELIEKLESEAQN